MLFRSVAAELFDGTNRKRVCEGVECGVDLVAVTAAADVRDMCVVSPFDEF
jgi:hypothetical protein